MDSPADFMDTAMHDDGMDDVYPCKGCGEVSDYIQSFFFFFGNVGLTNVCR